MERLIQQSFNFGVDQNHSGKVCKNRGLAFITVHQAGPLDSFYSFQGDFNCTKVWQPLDDYIVRWNMVTIIIENTNCRLSDLQFGE